MKRLNYFLCVLLACFTLGVSADGENSPKSTFKIRPPVIEEELSVERKSITVLGSKMTYLEQGEGDVVVFVHGNPTSSYLWRNVIPFVSDSSRAIAVDLIGMGHSDKPNIDYTFSDHYRYFSAFVKTLGAKQITVVGHDWGAAIAWEYARNNPEKVTRLAFMEGVLPPGFPVPSFESMGEEMGGMFKAFKDPVMGHKMVIVDNMFVEQVLPSFVNRTLGAAAMKEYRSPYLSEESRKPILVWPREVPIAGEPENTKNVMEKIAEFMGKTKMPVLLLYASPGVVTPAQAVPWYVERIKSIETSFVGTGFHFIQEDQPEVIGRGLADWIRRN